MKRYRDFFDKKTGKDIHRIVLIAVCLCIAFLLCIAFFMMALRRDKVESVQGEMRGYATSAQKGIDNQISGDFQTLRTVASSFSKIAEMDETSKAALFTQMNKANSFIRMGYADTDGNAVMYDVDGSRYSENYKNELFFQEALSGTEAMQDTSADPYGSGWVLYYAVPVKENGRITGVLLAVQNASFFSDIIDISIFNSTGYANIIDSTGKFVIRTNNPEVSSDSYTLFDLGNVNANAAYSIKMNLLSGVSGNYRFQTQDGE
ncbi:MAG: cache domain-containing protein [Christensenella sp.]|nr:cache domain-containing protein [Christensenella sp.]